MATTSANAIKKMKTEPTGPREEESVFLETDEIVKKIFEGSLPTRNSFLAVIRREGIIRRIRLKEETIYIGRSQECAVQFRESSISRKHACLYLYNEEYFIQDLESTNGVYINGVKIERASLRNHDHIELGEIHMTFVEY